jgi:hypothetical protein
MDILLYLGSLAQESRFGRGHLELKKVEFFNLKIIPGAVNFRHQIKCNPNFVENCVRIKLSVKTLVFFYMESSFAISFVVCIIVSECASILNV